MTQPSFPLRSTFLALPLQDEALREFQRLQAFLQNVEDFLTLQKPDTPHLTLMYWQEVGELEYQGIVEQVDSIARRTPAFRLQVAGTGTFGQRGRDTVLFFDVAFSPELALLKKACPWTDRRPFHPHITLARVHHSERFTVEKKAILKRLAHASFSFSCDRLRLYGAVDGRKQTPLQDAMFRG